VIQAADCQFFQLLQNSVKKICLYSKEKKMKFPGDHSHAFIDRYWLEPREIKGEKPLWRGVIEHVPSGRKLFLKGLNKITAFIESYLPGIDEIH
jgi:hypothetical protein